MSHVSTLAGVGVTLTELLAVLPSSSPASVPGVICAGGGLDDEPHAYTLGSAARTGTSQNGFRRCRR